MSVPAQWSKLPTEQWSSLEAWGVVFSKDENTRTALVNTGVTPSMLSHLDDKDWETVYACCSGDISNRGTINQLVSFMYALEDRQGPSSAEVGHLAADAAPAKSQRFHTEKPEYGKGPALDFLHRVETFLKREEVSASRVFSVLLLCVPDWAVDALSDAKHELQGKPFSEISDKIRKLLEPEKNHAHYMEEFMALAPNEGETALDFLRRFESYMPIISDREVDLPALKLFNSLPGHLQ
jgi:hypothetical protein